jgi:fructokinase
MLGTETTGGIEAGGTKFVCMVGSDPQHVDAEIRIQTESPDKTLEKVTQFFKPFVESGLISRLGVGSFGPIDVNPGSPTYGFITSTPKPGWRDFDLMGDLKRRLGIRVVMDTDVNAAGFGEFHWGAGKGYDPLLYLTIGTGIGGGYIKDGKPLHGLLTPEMGHIQVKHDKRADPFEGVCPFHGDCFEGLASGPAISKRLGEAGEHIPDDHPFWEQEAGYIASALTAYILVLSPKRIILGGGVMQKSFLLPLIRKNVQQELNGYYQHPSLLNGIQDYIVTPGLGNRSGIFGALAIAQESSK